jgi:tRNA (uracil-5-)-methyltransferase TRM9
MIKYIMDLSELEVNNVLNSYQKIANCFDDTRSYIWPSVKEFLLKIPEKSSILDAGCGNGKHICLDKNIILKKKFQFTGFDICENLLKITEEKVFDYYNDISHLIPIPKLYLSNITHIPEKNDLFDFVISIAVIHHLDTNNKRVIGIMECLRVLKPNGFFMFQVWSWEQDNQHFKFNKGDNLVPWKLRKKDVLKNVPKSEKNEIVEIINRYYYIFDKQEIYKLINTCISFKTAKLINCKNEKGNWIVILQKL